MRQQDRDEEKVHVEPEEFGEWKEKLGCGREGRAGKAGEWNGRATRAREWARAASKPEWYKEARASGES